MLILETRRRDAHNERKRFLCRSLRTGPNRRCSCRSAVESAPHDAAPKRIISARGRREGNAILVRRWLFVLKGLINSVSEFLARLEMRHVLPRQRD